MPNPPSKPEIVQLPGTGPIAIVGDPYPPPSETVQKQKMNFN